MTDQLLSKRGILGRLPLTRNRLDAAIASGEIAAFYTGLRTIKVRLSDAERLLATPPTRKADGDGAHSQVAA